MTGASRLWRKKLKKISEVERISHAHESVGVTVRMAILSNTTYKSNAFPIKIPAQFFTDLLERGILKVIWKSKKPRIVKRKYLFNKTFLEVSSSTTEQW